MTSPSDGVRVSDKPARRWGSEAGHWYGRDGSPQYTIVGVNGKERGTTLRDARKHGYVPSVTTIMKAAAKPGLERWKAEQLLMAALTLPRLAAEPEADWINRVWEDSVQQAIKAAERGTEIHAAIEQNLLGGTVDAAMGPFVNAAMAIIGPIAVSQKWSPEKSFACGLGYGGKVDLHSPEYVLDFKTKDGDLEGVKSYDEHFMQLAAYRHGLLLPNARCGIVFVSRTKPGQARLLMHTAEQSAHGWNMFEALLKYWQEAHDYSPTWQA